MTYSKFISIRGAREHNLKNIDLDLPRERLIVITGLSGSGKSSLAFDTIYAEGQRRYIESLSAYARQFLEMMQKPDVDQISGLSPAISIEQKTTSRNTRSTVATVTEIYDYMRLLFARVGTPFSPLTGLPIESQSVTEMANKIMKITEETKIYILAPFIRGRKGEYKKEFMDLQKKGFQRVKIDGVFYKLDDIPVLDKKKKHDIDVLVDRIVLRCDIRTRLVDSIETALKLSDGLLVVEFPDKPLEKTKYTEKSSYKSANDTHERIIFSQRFACPLSGFTIAEIEPRLFSFNNPFGACPACDGLGNQYTINPDFLIGEEDVSLIEATSQAWAQSTLPPQKETLATLGRFFSFDPQKKFQDLSNEQKTIILYGSKKYNTALPSNKQGKTITDIPAFEGMIPNLEKQWKIKKTSEHHEEIESLMSFIPCSSCSGYRLKPEALAIKIADKHIGEVSNLSIAQALRWFQEIPQKMSAQKNEIAHRILKEIQERLHFLDNVGLDYLTLSRQSGSLSGGESQRIRLASQIGSGLTGVLYVLDEPSIGLHQRDNARLIGTLKNLRNLGNTVIVVEHDEDAILEADYVVDIGPGAGVHGGEIIAQGKPEDIINHATSLTGQYLSGKIKIKIPEKRRSPDKKQFLKIIGARGNNLKNITAEIPLSTLTCITGVSGCGKSTFLIETLFHAASRQIMKSKKNPAEHDKIEGLEYIDKVIDIEQSPIGKTPRSNAATYIGAFTPIREWFAKIPESKARGYTPSRFSFNVKGGRCEACEGDGIKKIPMHFLPDVYVTCDACKGKRYGKETLEITFKDRSIADILAMTVEESIEFFATIPEIHTKLAALGDVGLGYITIGQSATTFSGGEAQRVKLAKELARRSTGKTLYILDEPTTGLHFHDVAKLVDILHKLVEQGNSVIVIEHNLEVIKTADWILDLGPEGGNKGGEIIAQGPPETIIAEEKSYTGYFLKELIHKTA